MGSNMDLVKIMGHTPKFTSNGGYTTVSRQPPQIPGYTVIHSSFGSVRQACDVTRDLDQKNHLFGRDLFEHDFLQPWS